MIKHFLTAGLFLILLFMFSVLLVFTEMKADAEILEFITKEKKDA